MTTTTKLSDTALVVLGNAAQRQDGDVLPLPSNLRGGAAQKVIDGLLKRDLIERLVDDDHAAVVDVLAITVTGLEAIGVEPTVETATKTPITPPPAEAKADEPPPKSKRAVKAKKAKAKKASAKTAKPTGDKRVTKQDTAVEMLKRAKGASNTELQEAFGWQPHTVRGFIAGAVKKKLGLTVTSEKDEKRGLVYSIAA